MSDMKDRVMQVILAEADVKKGFIPDHAKNKFSDNSGNLKCPFCQQELKKHLGGDMPEVWCCDNEKCKLQTIGGDIELWQELIRTRKALDVAVDAIKSAKTRLELINNSKFANLNNVLQIQCQCEVLKINETLEQITELEQKDVK